MSILESVSCIMVYLQQIIDQFSHVAAEYQVPIISFLLRFSYLYQVGRSIPASCGNFAETKELALFIPDCNLHVSDKRACTRYLVVCCAGV
jgi:hypothetical protein